MLGGVVEWAWGWGWGEVGAEPDGRLAAPLWAPAHHWSQLLNMECIMGEF